MAYKIDENVCISCGSCAGECPTEAISAGDNSYVIDADKCISCGTCVRICPQGAQQAESQLKTVQRMLDRGEGYGSGRAPFRFPCRNVLPAFRPADRYFS